MLLNWLFGVYFFYVDSNWYQFFVVLSLQIQDKFSCELFS